MGSVASRLSSFHGNLDLLTQSPAELASFVLHANHGVARTLEAPGGNMFASPGWLTFQRPGLIHDGSLPSSGYIPDRSQSGTMLLRAHLGPPGSSGFVLAHGCGHSSRRREADSRLLPSILCREQRGRAFEVSCALFAAPYCRGWSACAFAGFWRWRRLRVGELLLHGQSYCRLRSAC